MGEGTVGKTSLVAALRGDPFQKQARTHGIEVHPLELSHPDSGLGMTLRFWDFGGQEVYRATHQFFFSSDGLYLVVWNARAEQNMGDVTGWLNRIRQRVGDNAKVMLVATHSDVMEPDLGDYGALRRRFPNLLCGHYAVDNKTGRGIPELRAAIARQAAAQHVERVLPEAWIRARDAILARATAEPQIPYAEFARSCAAHGLAEPEAALLAELLHRLGQIVYHGGDDMLSDLVILNPEWLSKAIGQVLEDGPTREARGILDHARLPLIWQRRPEEPPYERHHYPYFLRLMEKFDISYRLEDGRHSLIAQLVPAKEPEELPWHRDTPILDGVRRLVLICRLSEPVTGLISAFTVRLGYADPGLCWRTGIFLRHPNPAYASEALVELAGTELWIEVRAPWPHHFLYVLQGTFEHLAGRWPGLEYQTLIPCPASSTDNCHGRFPLHILLGARQGHPHITCLGCGRSYEVAELLTGFSDPPYPVSPKYIGLTADQLRAIIADGISPLDQRIRDLQAAAASNAHAMRRLLALASTEITDCPRLFTLVCVPPQRLEKLKPHQRHFRLTLWCEHPDHLHPCENGSYTFVRPANWVRKVSRYARPILALLRTAVPVVGALADIMPTKEQLNRADSELEHMQELLDEFPELPDDGPDWTATESTQLTPAGSSYLRGVRHLLNDGIDGFRSYGGLERVQAASGEVLWVCAKHKVAYDPGLPAMS